MISALVLFESIRRLIHPPPVHGAPVLVVALAGIVANAAATWVLAKANRSSLNIAGAFQHNLTDLYASLGTAAAGIVIMLAGYATTSPRSRSSPAPRRPRRASTWPNCTSPDSWLPAPDGKRRLYTIRGTHTRPLIQEALNRADHQVSGIEDRD